MKLQRTGINQTTSVSGEHLSVDDVCQAFADALEVDAVAIDDDFFALGGTSLLGARLIRLLNARGLKVSYSELFVAKTPARLHASSNTSAERGQGEVGRASLTPAQVAIWQSCLSDPRRYIISRAFKLEPSVDPIALLGAVRQLLKNFPVLRSRIRVVDGQPTLLECPAHDFRADWSRQAEIDVWLRDWFAAGLVIDDELFRWGVAVEEASASPVVALQIHHIIADEWSIGRLLASFEEALSDEAGSGAVPQHRSDHVSEVSLEGAASHTNATKVAVRGIHTRAAELLDVFRCSYVEPSPLQELRPNAIVREFKSSSGSREWTKLLSLFDVSEFVMTLAVYFASAAVVKSFGPQGVSIAMSTRTVCDPVLEPRVSLVPVAVDAGPALTFGELVGGTAEAAAQSFDHRWVDYGHLVDELSLRAPHLSGVFRTTFTYVNDRRSQRLYVDGLPATVLSAPRLITSSPLALSATCLDGEVVHEAQTDELLATEARKLVQTMPIIVTNVGAMIRTCG